MSEEQEKIEELQKQVWGYMEMLALVLSVQGATYVSDARIREGLPAGTAITVDQDVKNGGFWFGLAEDGEDETNE